MSRQPRRRRSAVSMQPPDADPLTPAALQQCLRAPVFGHRVFYYETIGSTNDRALELAARGEPEGSLVLAEEQTAGRGRRDRTWESKARRGIYASVILRPSVPAARTPLFTFAAATAVAAALRDQAGLDARIKWPNDVVAGARKIAGVLAETRGSDPEVREMVVGVGINVGQRAADFPAAWRQRATSVLIETRTAVRRATLLAAFLEGFERRCTRLLRDGPAELLREWSALSAVPRGRRVAVAGAGERIEGVVQGVDEEGALLLEDPSGGVRRVPFGEIVESLWP